MNRRSFLASLAPAPRPNILFLLSDDQRWDTLGCMGNRLIKTPHLDRLASQGTLFERAFVTTAICAVSRASVFSGQYARRHGIHDFATTFPPEAFAQTYPQLLRAAGYRTGFIGKYGVGNKMPTDAFDFWRGFPGQGKYFPQGEPGPHLTTIMGEQALDFLGAADARPWCLSISFKAAHVQDEDPRQFLPSPESAHLYDGVTFPVPKTADPKYFDQLPERVQKGEARARWHKRFDTPEKYQTSVRNYYRLISEMDTQVGRMLEKVDLGNTLVVFLGDNGFYLGEHGLAGKWYPHEESIRVPLLLAGPGVKRNQRRQDFGLNIDVAPTILAAAGLPIPPRMQGHDLRRPQRRGEFFYEHLFKHPGIPQTEGLRTERYKYFRYIESQPVREEVYDLSRDPLEENNLANTNPAMLAKLRAHCDRLRTAVT